MIYALTGHRPPRLNNEWDHNGPCSNFVRQQLQIIIDSENVTKMISGIALGSDFIWAELALENNIPLVAAIPFKGQELKWHKEHINQYNRIVDHIITTKKIVSSGGYSYQKMIIRDHFMVDNSDVLVAVYDNTPRGGTYKTIEYAKQKNKKIIYIDPNEFQLN